MCMCVLVSHFGARFSLQKQKRSQESIRKKRRRIRLLKKRRIWARKALSKTTTTPPDTPSSFSQNELLETTHPMQGLTSSDSQFSHSRDCVHSELPETSLSGHNDSEDLQTRPEGNLCEKPVPAESEFSFPGEHRFDADAEEEKKRETP